MTKRNLRSKPSTVGEDAELLFQKKIRDLESLNESLKLDVEELKSKLAGVSVTSSSGGTLQSSRASNKSIATKEEGMSSRSKSNPRSMCSTKKQHGTESCVKQVDGEVQKLKAQKVKLQCKIKLDSMQFRLSKASLEKETLQLKKELRKSEFEKHVLSALNRRQKQILQLKNTQALTALKRLKLLLQPKKTFSKKNNGLPKGTSSTIQAGVPTESSNEVVLLVKLNKIHSGYERQMKEIAEEVKKFSLEASVLKAEFEGEQNSFSPSCDNGVNQTPIDSELKELKEEFSKLSTLVSQMEMAKPQFSQTDRVQTGPVEYSVPSKDKDESNLILSQERTSVYGTSDESRSIEPSQVKESGEALSSEEAHSKKEQSKAEMCCSCTKKSLCKTKSCKCRANGSGCGISCGCIASKCSNRGENVRSDKGMQAVVDGKKPVDDTKVANKQPLRDIGNIQEAGKVGKLKKVQKPVAKKK
ncbi:chromosome-associated kinesin-related [Raphanus sativus]|uniref:Kinesin-like protein KIN-4C isoform X1 n=1 Tax=Raphanus sativus TaxID=3726 RepID=A0A6J0KNS0_RAPSA|nr:kinesin-like protein KIN-4C isoform X1 [Raphanus sativus]KAJ4881322.1 chromosome-associated kinesin-related [Raphanus sativus]